MNGGRDFELRILDFGLRIESLEWAGTEAERVVEEDLDCGLKGRSGQVLKRGEWRKGIWIADCLSGTIRIFACVAMARRKSQVGQFGMEDYRGAVGAG